MGFLGKSLKEVESWLMPQDPGSNQPWSCPTLGPDVVQIKIKNKKAFASELSHFVLVLGSQSWRPLMKSPSSRTRWCQGQGREGGFRSEDAECTHGEELWGVGVPASTTAQLHGPQATASWEGSPPLETTCLKRPPAGPNVTRHPSFTTRESVTIQNPYGHPRGLCLVSE